MSRVRHVLFLCSGNSGRSIMAEAILQREGAGKFAAFSAGSHPTGRINPLSLEQLASEGFPTAGLYSKSWRVFAGAQAPPMDFIIGVCDKVATQEQPVWPGHPVHLWWHFPAPGAVQGSDAEVRAAFRAVSQQLQVMLRQFIAHPDDAAALARLNRAQNASR